MVADSLLMQLADAVLAGPWWFVCLKICVVVGAGITGIVGMKKTIESAMNL